MVIPTLKIKKNYPDAQIPQRAYPTDSGLDLYAYSFDTLFTKDEVLKGNGWITAGNNYVFLSPMSRLLVDTGISATVGEGYEIQLRPRSGLAVKNGISVLNTPGTIDEQYRGPFKVILINLSEISQKITLGDKIAQMVVCPVILSEVEEVKELESTERGSGGFGHSGV